jgi:hypothetical protein
MASGTTEFIKELSASADSHINAIVGLEGLEIRAHGEFLLLLSEENCRKVYNQEETGKHPGT